MAKGLLAILSGPSGVGKSSIVKTLLRDERFCLSISATTRAPREGERDGVDYFFLEEKEFRGRIDRGAFLEHAVVHGKCRYGTLRSEVERLKNDGRVVILDIDVQGALSLADEPDSTSLFVAPPSFEHLEARLRGRGTETEEQIRERLETARQELLLQDRYEHVVVNDDLATATETIRRMLLDKTKPN